MLNGVCSVFSSGGILSGSQSHLVVHADLIIHELWNDPPTSPIDQAGQSVTEVDISCDSVGVFTSNDQADEFVHRGSILEYDLLALPPKAMVAFDVSCVSDVEQYDDADADSDFFLGEMQVLCPGILINILQS